jgi:hypothetical protein
MKFFSDWIVTERPRDGEMENSSQFSVLGSQFSVCNLLSSCAAANAGARDRTRESSFDAADGNEAMHAVNGHPTQAKIGLEWGTMVGS